MKRVAILIIALICSSVVSWGQVKVVENEVKRVLEMPKKYFHFTFKLYDQEGKEEMKTQVDLWEKQNNFSIVNDYISALGNDNTLWKIDHDRKEVEISTFDNDNDLLTPKSILKALSAGVYKENPTKSTIKSYDFTPTDKEKDFYKIRIGLHRNNNQLKDIMVYFKDGSRVNLDFITIASDFDETRYVTKFDSKSYESYHIEDLRTN